MILCNSIFDDPLMCGSDLPITSKKPGCNPVNFSDHRKSIGWPAEASICILIGDMNTSAGICFWKVMLMNSRSVLPLKRNECVCIDFS